MGTEHGDDLQIIIVCKKGKADPDQISNLMLVIMDQLEKFGLGEAKFYREFKEFIPPKEDKNERVD